MCTLCSWTYISKRIKEFHFCLLLMTSACVGVFSALDFVLFYLFWEAMLVPMYLLIAVWGGPRRRYASIKFFLYTVAGSVMLLVAIIAFNATWAKTRLQIPELTAMAADGTIQPVGFQMWTFLAMSLAFAIKVPMFPFHTWLPAAHVQAPAAGSVLPGLGAVEDGRVRLPALLLAAWRPIASFDYFAPIMIAISIVLHPVWRLDVALGQHDVKKLIAYSSVAHMGFVHPGHLHVSSCPAAKARSWSCSTTASPRAGCS